VCIIAYRPKTARLDGKAINRLQNCFTKNKDGAGFMYVDPDAPDTVRIVKGLMKWEDFKRAIKMHGLRSKGDVVFHFRIGTHGLTNEGNTHPFPVTAAPEVLWQTNSKAAAGFMHNGILHLQMDKDEPLSDTAMFVKHLLAPCSDNGELLDMVGPLLDMIGGKFATMTPTDGVNLYGDFNEHKGWYYSNYSYKEWTYVYQGATFDSGWHKNPQTGLFHSWPEGEGPVTRGAGPTVDADVPSDLADDDEEVDWATMTENGFQEYLAAAEKETVRMLEPKKKPSMVERWYEMRQAREAGEKGGRRDPATLLSVDETYAPSMVGSKPSIVVTATGPIWGKYDRDAVCHLCRDPDGGAWLIGCWVKTLGHTNALCLRCQRSGRVRTGLLALGCRAV
jgi:hypothetical protein